MKKIQLGICPDSIHPETGRAVFVYCNSLTQPGVEEIFSSKPKYAIEFGSFFPHTKAEISKGVFAVSEGHTDQLSFYGEDMFPDCFQTTEQVFFYAKSKILELEKQLAQATAGHTLKSGINSVSYISAKIALAAWKSFVEQFGKAMQEDKVDSLIFEISE